MADAGPPLVVTAIGLILWLAVDATLAGISIQTIGIILVVVGVAWLLIELVITPRRRTTAVREQPCGARARDLLTAATDPPAPSPGAGERPAARFALLGGGTTTRKPASLAGRVEAGLRLRGLGDKRR